MTRLYERFLACGAVSTDTRRIVPGSIFFALHGATFDGNRFVDEALAKGAAWAVADDPAAAADPRVILVEDTLSTLQSLARTHRRALGLPILAVAGSNGKTTTKELVSRVLAERFDLCATQGNLNNHIGVPLTLLAMTSRTRFGVVEMGASACGEIATLCSIAEPDYGILTNVGRAHLEGFGGVEGVRRGKGELYDWLAAHGGTAFVRTDDPVLAAMAAERPALHVSAYAETAAAGIASALEGDYNRYNIAAAAAIGRHFGIDEASIARAIGSYAPDNNRSQRIESGRNTVIADCYNANPSSMRAAVGHFLAEPLGCRQQRLLILGEMRELGAWSGEEHRAVIRQAAADPSAELWLVGPAFREAMEELRSEGFTAPRVALFADCETLCRRLAEAPLDQALVLLKGSHGVGLERAIALL